MYHKLQILGQPGQTILALGLGVMALMVLGLLRVNLWVPLVVALARSLLQLTVLAVGVSIALAVPVGGTIGFGLILGLIATQFTFSRLELPIDRPQVVGILSLAAAIPTLYAVLGVLQPSPLYAPQAWIPVFSLSLASAAAIVLQAGNGFWQEFQRQHPENFEAFQEFEDLDDFESSDFEDLEDPKTPPSPSNPNSKLKTQNSLWQDVLAQTLRLRFQQMTALGLVSLPLVFAAQLLVNIDPLTALVYEVLLMLTSLNSALIALWGLQPICGGLAKRNTMRRGIPKV